MGKPESHSTSMLIADVGGTSARWAWVALHPQRDIHQNESQTGISAAEPFVIKTEGFHPYHNEDSKLYSLLHEKVIPALGSKAVDEVYYYGTGCSSADMCNRVSAVIGAALSGAAVEIAHDMLGAARATCGTEPGITCILGTGSNSCAYDGKQITRQQISLGYILGDEGSGAHMGRLLLTEARYNKLPEALNRAFSAYAERLYGDADLLQYLYRTTNPSQFLASLVPFLASNMHVDVISNLVESSLNLFFDTHVSTYPEVASHQVHFAGGLAITFRETIHKLCTERGWQTGQFTGDPIAGMIQYHQKIANYEQ